MAAPQPAYRAGAAGRPTGAHGPLLENQAGALTRILHEGLESGESKLAEQVDRSSASAIAGLWPRARRRQRRHTVPALLAISLLCVMSVATGADPPMRVASLNLCTDQLLLALADPEQIASVTFLSQHRTSSYMARAAAQQHANHGHAEELVSLKPDLVVTLTYTQPSVLRLLDYLGFRVELFAPANNLEEVTQNIRRMAQLLGQKPRGENTIASMQERLAVVLTADASDQPRGVLYEPNGYTAGKDTLRGDLIRIAGWHNVASEVGIEGVGVIGLESLILAKPGRLILSPYAPGTHALGNRVLHHPALREITAGREPLIISPSLWICGGPMNTEAVARLVQGR